MKAQGSLFAALLTVSLWSCGPGSSTIAGDVPLEVDAQNLPDLAPEAMIADLVPESVQDVWFDLHLDLGHDLHLDWWEPTEGGAGWPCDDGDQCDSGLCIMTQDGKQCTITCEEECPFGWECVQHTASLPDTVFICTPLHMELCKPCETNADCETNGADTGAACVSYGPAGAFCGAACQAEGDGCPSAYDCSEVQDLAGQWSQQCLLAPPPDDYPPSPPICQCVQWFVDQQATTDCRVENEFGSCSGRRMCAAEGLTACDASTPAVEQCNGTDDNCDGQVDNDVVLGECFVQSPYGMCPGVDQCVNGALMCDGPTPKQELCDGEDNDCDGEVDENFEDTDNDGIADCLESDKDGDGIADGLDNCPSVFNPNQLDSDFDLNGDACDPDDDNDQVPDGEDCAPLDKDAFPGAVEVCDGTDNNCNAIVDEGFADTDADGWKDCVDDDDDGDESPDELDCMPLEVSVHPLATESCNGIDDDCDADTDEGFPDMDDDGMADCADDDLDGDGVDNEQDNCSAVSNQGQEDLDLDGVGDACDMDVDGDSIPNGVDNCPQVKNTVQGDIDEDGIGDACDDDKDGDDVANGQDNCPMVANPGQEDSDGDGVGDACADDKDGDGVPDNLDCKPLDPDVYPGASEVCDGLDNDCDLTEDEGFPDFDADGIKNCVDTDDDDDGDGDDSDCEPLNPAIHTGAPEVCDGLDNNCNGKPDEGLGELQCGKGQCQHKVPACLNGLVQACDPFQGVAPEVCDGLDNDCDGLADEDLGQTTCGLGPCLHTIPKCQDGSPTFCDPVQGAVEESCDGLDNDCDGKVDEELGSESCGTGLCFHTIPLCLGGVPQECNSLEGAKPEVCDGQDNNCNGLLDEDLGETTCGFGNCQHTVPNCQDGAANICNPFEGAAPETCDDQDNDCDGLKDEDLGLLTCGLGICQHSVPACVGGQANTCDPLQGADVETCGDGVDNNCDGVTDAKCGAAGTGTCIGELCCDMACNGTCASCTQEGLEGTCTSYDAGTDPEEECGDFQCNGNAIEEPGFSACFVECTEEEALVQCKAGMHCDDGLCLADLIAGQGCDEDTDCQSGRCRLDWDGDGMFCAADETGCVRAVPDDETALPPEGWVECAGGDGYRVCQGGIWSPAAPEAPLGCPAGVCDNGCGYVTDDDNGCVSGQGLGDQGGCEFEHLVADFACVDCGHLTASLGQCNSGLESCSKECGAACVDGELDEPGVTYCHPDINGDLWKRLDGCYEAGAQCAFADDQQDNDEVTSVCGAFDCVNDNECLTSCTSSAQCNDGMWCGPDGKCYDGGALAPWAHSGAYLVLTKDDDTYFNGSDCPGNFFGVNEATVQGVPFRVGPHMYGSKLAGLQANVVVPTPNQSWLVKNVHFVFPGGRCSGQPLKVTFMYADGSSGETGQASIPHDCGNGGTWSGSNYQIISQGTYGGPCCDWWYYGKFTNPNPAKAVAKVKPYYYDGCGGSYNGQLWAATID